MRSKRLFRPSLLLALAVLVPLVSLPLAHATGITFKSFCHNSISGTTINCTLSGLAVADTIIVSIFGIGVFNSFAVTDGQSNSYTEQVFSLTGSGAGISTYIFTTLSAASSGSDIVTVATGGPSRNYAFTASDYAGVTGFGKTGTDQQDTAGNSGSSTVSLSGTAGTSAMIDDFEIIGSTFTVSTLNGQTIRDSFSGGCQTGGNPCVADSTSPILGWSWSGGAGCQTPPQCFASHSSLELTGLVTGPINTVFQCYGNCGSPPITLVNTNSTHTVNFNQTITLFYQFQSNLNGFLLNVTVSMAKSYTAIPNGPAFGVYTIQSCPLGQTPFSPQCPGLLQAQSAGQNTFSPPKGKISFSGLRIPVSTGQWVGIALSAFLSGLDVNDTNTNVPLFQTNEGKIPSSIQAPSSLGNSKVGLWTWITGNAIVGTSPPSSGFGTSCFGLDCILSNAVNSLCQIVTTTCQTGSSIFLIIILTVVTLMVTLMGFSYALPSMNITTRGMGEFAVIIFIGWFAMFGSLGLLLPWLMILMFFVVAWLFLGRSRGTGPI